MMVDTTRLRELLGQITPGAWEANSKRVIAVNDSTKHPPDWRIVVDLGLPPPDCEFIALARNLLPEILEALDAQEKELAALREAADMGCLCDKQRGGRCHIHKVFDQAALGTREGLPSRQPPIATRAEPPEPPQKRNTREG